MNRLVLIRHGECTANVDHDFYKYPDSCVALTAKGILQSIECAKSLKDQKIDFWSISFSIFCSRFTRARQTARIILDCMGLRHIEPFVTPSLNERHVSHGETQEETQARVVQWWKQQESLLAVGPVMLVAHEFVISGLMAYLDGVDEYPEGGIPNATPFIYGKVGDRYLPLKDIAED